MSLHVDLGIPISITYTYIGLSSETRNVLGAWPV